MLCCYSAAQSLRTQILYGDVNAEATTRLLALARSKGTTITGALSAAVTCATNAVLGGQESTPDGQAPVTSPVALALAVDTRRLYEPKLAAHELGYHVSGCMVVETEPLVRQVTHERSRRIPCLLLLEFIPPPPPP